MSYLHPDGSPDTNEDLLESVRCFCAVISQLLHPNEGMVIELPFQEKYPTDRFGKYLVWRDEQDRQIKVNKLSIKDDIYSAADGQLVWVHNEIIH